MNPTERLLGKLPDARRSGAGWVALCPAHDDHNPSLSVAEGDNGGVVINCHKGCSPQAVCKSLGLTLRDLMPGNACTSPQASAPSTGQLESPVGNIVATYDYRDETGNLIFPVGPLGAEDIPAAAPHH